MTDSDNKSGNGGTWGSLVGVIGGAALGYWAGRSSENPNGCGCNAVNNCGCNYGNGGFNSFEAGKTQAELTAGLNYTGQAIAATRQDIVGLTAAMNANFQRLEDRQFQQILAENTALKTDLSTATRLAPIQNELTGMYGVVNCMSKCFMPGYVQAVSLCPSTTTTAAA